MSTSVRTCRTSTSRCSYIHDLDLKVLPTPAFHWLADQLPDGQLKLIRQYGSMPVGFSG